MKKCRKIIIIILLSMCLLCLGYYAGKRDGLYQGSWEYQNCINNGATGWYVDGDKFNCIF